MAQYDLVFVKNNSSSGVEYSETKLGKPSGAGYVLTQDPTSGALTWTRSITYMGEVTGVINFDTMLTPGYYTVEAPDNSSVGIPDINLGDAMLTVTSDGTIATQTYQLHSRASNYNPIAFVRGKKGVSWSTWVGYGGEVAIPPTLTGANIIGSIIDENNATARLVTDTEKTTWDSKSNLALGTASTNAYRGDYGNTAYVHSQATHAPTGAQANADITKAEIEAKLTGEISSHSHAVGSSLLEFNSQSGTTYTLVLSDTGKLIRANNSSSINITVPPNSSVAFELGTVITIEQQGVGVITLLQGSGVTILSSKRKTNGQNSVIQLYKISTDIWNAIGGVE